MKYEELKGRGGGVRVVHAHSASYHFKRTVLRQFPVVEGVVYVDRWWTRVLGKWGAYPLTPTPSGLLIPALT